MSGNGTDGNGTGLHETVEAMSPPGYVSALSGVNVPLRALNSFLLSRYQLGNLWGFNTQFNGVRNLNLILGYDETIDISSYRYEYERGGIAKRIVEIFPRATWANGFEVVDDENLKRKTVFEKVFAAEYKRLDIPGKLLRASILAYLGHYSVILIGAPGKPEEPLPRKRLKSDEISFLLPLGEDKAKIVELVGQSPTDESVYFDPRFGLPLYYEVNLSANTWRNQSNIPGSSVSANFSRRVHWSRIIHVVNDPLDNEVIGQPILRSVWNLLHDLKKLTGGLSEAALRRGWPGLHANVDKDVKLARDSPEITGIKEQLEDYTLKLLNGITTKGVSVNSLGSQGSIAIKDNAEAILEQIAGTIGAPMRLIRGSERGDLASTQDRSNFQDRIMEIRMSHNDPTAKGLISRLHEHGYLPPPKNPDYRLEFPEEEELNETEKAQTAKIAAQSKVLTVDEIRDRIYALDPMPVESTIPAVPEDTLPSAEGSA